MLESEGMPPRRYGVGDVILFRDGAHVKWHVERYVKEIAFFRQTLPFGLGYAVCAINKRRMFVVPGGHRSSPLRDPTALYDLMGKPTRDAAPARLSKPRETHNVN